MREIVLEHPRHVVFLEGDGGCPLVHFVGSVESGRGCSLESYREVDPDVLEPDPVRVFGENQAMHDLDVGTVAEEVKPHDAAREPRLAFLGDVPSLLADDRPHRSSGPEAGGHLTACSAKPRLASKVVYQVGAIAAAFEQEVAANRGAGDQSIVLAEKELRRAGIDQDSLRYLRHGHPARGLRGRGGVPDLHGVILSWPALEIQKNPPDAPIQPGACDVDLTRHRLAGRIMKRQR